jgi:sporulation protein YlmC with PRC-barrel domain
VSTIPQVRWPSWHGDCNDSSGLRNVRSFPATNEWSSNMAIGQPKIVNDTTVAGHQGPGPEVLSADTLSGDDVVNDAGENLGEIRDIMIDVPSGRVAYAVLSFGGFLGMGNKLFAIPWQALQLDADNKRFILDMDKERLETAPGFDKDQWPSMADNEWARDVHEYYGQRPYWE